MSSLKTNTSLNQEALAKEKKVMDTFLHTHIPEELFKILITKTFLPKLQQWEQDAEQKKNEGLTARIDLKNFSNLKKQLSVVNQITYWQLLQVLLRFPGNFQIGLNNDLLKIMRSQQIFKILARHIDPQAYLKKSMKMFLTDCYAFSCLREEQSKVLVLGEEQRAKEMENHLAIINNHFLLIERLGGKGIISVYKGVKLDTNKYIVIKHIQKKTSMTKAHQIEMERFAREARAFARLEKHRKEHIHKGELHVDDYFVKAYRLAKGHLYKFSDPQDGFSRRAGENIEFMVMRYIEGAGLDALLKEYQQKNATMALKIAMYILRGLLEALEYCRKENIVHRDICPGNILLTKQFQVRLTNLGWSKLEDMTHLTQQGAFIGNASYTAPEGIFLKKDQNFESLVSATDHRFDLYSVGCIAYELFVGQLPFTSIRENKDKRELEILKQHLYKNPIPPKRLRPELSDKVNTFVMKLLAKKPEDRYNNAEEALTALRDSFSIGQKANVFTRNLIGKKRSDVTQEFRLEDLNRKKRLYLMRRVLVVVCILAVLAGGWFLGGGEYILNYRQRSKCEKILRQLKTHYQQLHGKWQPSHIVVTRLKEKFPASEGYPEVGKETLTALEKSGVYIKELHVIIQKGEKKLLQDVEKTLPWLQKFRDYPQKNHKMYEDLIRIYDKMAVTQRQAVQLKKIRDQERDVRKTYAVLKEYIKQAKKLFASIYKKVKVLRKEYPVKKGFLKVDRKIPGLFKKQRERAIDIQKLLKRLAVAIKENSFSDAAVWIAPYRDFQLSELERLRDMNESIEETLRVNRGIKEQRQKQRKE